MRVSVNLNAQKPDTTTNAVIYARYSSHGQTEQSIEGQLAKGHEYAAAQGYTVVHEYIDRAMTGRNDNREAFQKMLSDTGKHQFQVVIVWKVDRFGRNREEIAFNKHTCKKNGVRVEYVAESLPNSPEAVILESVLEGMAEYYSIQLSQNIRRGQLESAKKCQCVGGSVPLGYTLDSDKHFVIDPQTAPVVKKIFDLYAEGATISEITGQLNEQGIRTARKQLFTKNSLTKLLKNEKYIGVYTYKDIVRVEGGVPAIVDESTFDRVQELLKINRRAPSHTWTKVEYLLTDKLFCGHCGSPMVGESGFSHTGAKYSYYGCIKRRREKACDKKPVRQDWIEALVLDETVKLLHDDELMEYIIDRTWEYYQVTDKVQEEKAVLEAQLAEVDKAINNLVRAIEAGIFNAATKSRMDELDAQKAALTASLADLELTSGIRITRDHIEYFLLRLRDLDVKDRECQKRLVQTFVNAVFIYDDGRVKITYNYSGQSSTITLNQIASAEKGKGFVCCLPCFTEARGQIHPEIHRLECCCHVKLRVIKRQCLHACQQHFAAASAYGGLVELSRLLYADGRIVDTAHFSRRALFQHQTQIRAAAAPTVQHIRILRQRQEAKPPVRKRPMSDVHHGDHEAAAEACRLAGVREKRHMNSSLFHQRHN